MSFNHFFLKFRVIFGVCFVPVKDNWHEIRDTEIRKALTFIFAFVNIRLKN